jgi:hypothetical protein
MLLIGPVGLRTAVAAVDDMVSISGRLRARDSRHAGAISTARGPFATKNSTFQAKDLPDSLFFVRGKSQEFVIRGRGKWKAVSHQNEPVVMLSFSDVENFRPEKQFKDASSVLSMPINIYHTRSDFYLYYYDGDPDAGRIIKFRKIGK